MCGFAGMLGSGAAVSEAILARMNDSIQRRGPDDFGYWLDEGCGIALGHRRLAIVDLSAAGHQPMASTSGRYVIAFNGEIYNHLDIRAELERGGRANGWRGHSDTETLLEGIAAWGLRATLQRCAGMFSLALWDREDRKLLLARDRMGEKPLYYGWLGGDCFAFASELQALRAHPRFSGRIDRGAVALFAQHNYVPAPWTIYERISKLEPGCIAEVTREAREPRIERYWSFEEAALSGVAAPFSGTPEEAVAQTEALATEVIRRQMVADVPLGAFLSGGIDSSTVVALMQAQSSRRVRTFTIGFEEAGYNEAGHAKQVAQHLGTDHTELYLTSQQARDVIPLLQEIYTEPFADSSQIPTYLVSRLARQHVTVALSGDGGDELFAGYSRYQRTLARWNRIRRVPTPIRRAGGATAALLGRIAMSNARRRELAIRLERAAPALISRTVDELYLSDISHMRPPAAWVPGAPPRATAFDSLPTAFGNADALRRLMAVDTVTYLPDDVLAKVDRAAMAVSLETRVPFLDHRFVEFAWTLPTEVAMRDGQTKWPLRQVLYRHVPRSLVERPKMGFGVPVGDWLRRDLRDWAEDLLGPDRLRSEGWWSADRVQEIWRQHQAGLRDWSFQLWTVLMFQAWLDSLRPTREPSA